MNKKEYYVFIDESGSYNDLSYGNFQVTLVFIDKSKIKGLFSIVKGFKTQINKSGIFPKGKEIKAHSIKEHALMEYLISFWNKKLASRTYYTASYIENHDFKPLNFGEMYSWLIKTAIERAIDQKIINENDALHIIADSQTIKTSYDRTLREYLNKETITTISKLEFVDSNNHEGIFIADVTSFLINAWIQDKSYCIWDKSKIFNRLTFLKFCRKNKLNKKSYKSVIKINKYWIRKNDLKKIKK